MRFFKNIKSNNKGDTLVIVLIGMLIIGVLGTVVLKASSVNVGMKINNLKSKQNFYYVEKAIDDVYAGLGMEVSKAVQFSYDSVIGNMVEKDISGIKPKDAASLKTKFETNYINQLSEYTNKPIDDILNHLQGFLGDYSKLNIAISLGKSQNPSTPTEKEISEVDGRTIIKIKNVVVKSISSKNYESSVTTDFIIETPVIEFSFNESDSTNLDEFYKYALIADGDIDHVSHDADANEENGALEVKQGVTITVNGNIYAGEYKKKDARNQWINKEGIFVGNNARLDVNGANVVSKGAVNLATGSNIGFNGESNGLSLRLWAKDILLSGNGAIADINGDCFIKDDLEVNGNEGKVNISGSYYGFGFDGNYNGGQENDSGETVNFKPETLGEGENPQREHEKRSAVIVNGNRADVRLASDESSTKHFILGGRAYIDLSTNVGAQTKNADYMTGESISIKGNQKIYLVDNPAAYQTGDSSLFIKGNPMAEIDFKLMGLPENYTKNDFYNFLSLDSNHVIAKKAGESIYFYNKQNNPDLQTQYVVDNVRNTTKDYWDKINEAVGNMDIINLCLGDNTRSYTVGTAMQVKQGEDGRGHLTIKKGDELAYQDNGMDESEFFDILSDVNNRYSNIMYNLNDDRSNLIGTDKIPYNSETKSPYQCYINSKAFESLPTFDGTPNRLVLQPFVNAGNKTEETVYPAGTDLGMASLSTDELKEVGIDERATVVLSVCDNKDTKTKIEALNGLGVNKVYGILICSGDVVVNRDFEGMIISGGDIIVSNNCTVTANPKLIKKLREKSVFLKQLLQGSITTIVPSEDSGDMITLKDGKFAFDDYVKFENWRKNAD